MFNVSWLCCDNKKFVFLEDPAPWKWLDSRTAPADSGDLTALWWSDSETCGGHSYPKKSSNANLTYVNRGQPCCGFLFLGKKSGKQSAAKNPSCCRWRRKRDVFSCKLVRYCNTKLVLIWTRNLEAPELKAETSTHRPRFWDLGVLDVEDILGLPTVKDGCPDWERLSQSAKA